MRVALLTLAALLTATQALADPPGPRLGQQTIRPKTPDCYCTDATRQRLEIGATICLTVGGQSFTAPCQMSLNVPMWRKIGDGCQTSALPQGRQPAG